MTSLLRFRTRIALPAALALSLAGLSLTGCASGEPGSTKPGGSSPTSSAVNSDVTLVSLNFMPETLTVSARDTVTWVNGESITHTITSGAFSDVDETTGLRGSETSDGLFDERLGQKGGTFSYTFETAGTYPYFCDIHDGMNATVVVEEG
ncbi:cupredoxin domain-containing protein [Mycetocola miduiensis]|uniref:Plastocyanin n=1 Tax=Mycetocola miduiensis TaxID=995034 RepID=A0A1I5DT27_9MICO|nr:plastocyanin/azurin family copper-binding protein [Mycetocola miduiensis]SFO02393.1 Plastocyanin [Mycetocola miduiensis]